MSNANAMIENLEFSLFYDTDELDKGNLYRLTERGQIEWFQKRIEAFFLEPLRRMFNTSSPAYKVLNSYEGDPDATVRTATIIAFSSLLNGIESLGAFITPEDSGNGKNFRALIRSYMREWDVNVCGTVCCSDPSCKDVNSRLKNILWKHFRCGITHGFVIEHGSLEINLEKKWDVYNQRLIVNPILFFEDFELGLRRFFLDTRKSRKQRFIARFHECYPPRDFQKPT